MNTTVYLRLIFRRKAIYLKIFTFTVQLVILQPLPSYAFILLALFRIRHLHYQSTNRRWLTIRTSIRVSDLDERYRFNNISVSDCGDGSEPMQSIDIIDGNNYISCTLTDDGDDNCTRPFVCDRITFYCCLSLMSNVSLIDETANESVDRLSQEDGSADDGAIAATMRLRSYNEIDHERYCGSDGRLLKGLFTFLNCWLKSIQNINIDLFQLPTVDWWIVAATTTVYRRRFVRKLAYAV